MTKSKVSICIPSYNHAHFLPTTIESALAQTYKNIEIIIVDDGSTDNSLEIAESYAEKYPSTVFVYTHPGLRNRGISATINLTAEKATGEYWSIMGSDDILYPHKTERQVAFLEEHPDVTWVYSPVQFVDEHGTLLPEFYGDDITQGPKPTEQLITENCIPPMAVMARSAQFAQVGPHREDLLYSDWEFFVRMSALFKAGFIAEPLVQYRVHSSNVSLGVETIEKSRRYLAVLDSLQRNSTPYGGEIATPRLQSLIEFRRTRFLFTLDQVNDAAAALRSVFQIYPLLLDNPETIIQWMKGSYDPESYYDWLSGQLPPLFNRSYRRQARRLLIGLVSARAAKSFHESGDLHRARKMAFQAIRADLRWSKDRAIVLALAEALGGPTVFRQMVRLKQRVKRTPKHA